jgi:hypothetical protein
MNELILRLQRVSDCARAEQWASEQCIGREMTDLDIERSQALSAEMDKALAELEGGFDAKAYLDELLAKTLSPEYIRDLEKQADTSGA